ncbi:hypothetical protein GCM10009677_00320 [Sphaerisporangium rubeum]
MPSVADVLVTLAPGGAAAASAGVSAPTTMMSAVAATPSMVLIFTRIPSRLTKRGIPPRISTDPGHTADSTAPRVAQSENALCVKTNQLAFWVTNPTTNVKTLHVGRSWPFPQNRETVPLGHS